MMLTLYSTEGCHLCEMALELIQRAKPALKVDIIDIAFDDELFLRYGVTIPVLCYDVYELNWPFTQHELLDWLKNNGINYHQ
jgi:glutaredoxin